MDFVPGWGAYLLVGCTGEEASKESCADSAAVNKLLCNQGVGPMEDMNESNKMAAPLNTT